MSGELAGALTERVILQRRLPARDDLAGASGDWTLLTSVWASMAPIGPAEPARGDAIDAMPRWSATMRLPCDVGPGDRLVWRGRKLRVRGRTDDPRTPDRVLITAEEER